MPVKWKLFALANYLFLFAYLLLFIGVLRFIIEEVPHEQPLKPLLPLIAGQLIVILNSILNIYVFHKHLPNKLFSKTLKTAYIISTVLFVISLVVIIISLNQAINDELKVEQKGNFIIFIQSLFFLHIFLGLFILINQFLIRRFIEIKK
jgi:carbon starvation protein CstA